MRIVLLAHGATAEIRAAAFPDDTGLEQGGRRAAAARTAPRADRVISAASRRCRETAEAMGLSHDVDDALAGPDHGSWTGRTLDDVATTDPGGLTAWLTDPDARPHGGEPLAGVVARVGAWLDARTDPPHALLAVVDPAVVRAAVVHALGAPAISVFRVDVAPLSLTTLSGAPGRWSLGALERTRGT